MSASTTWKARASGWSATRHQSITRFVTLPICFTIIRELTSRLCSDHNTEFAATCRTTWSRQRTLSIVRLTFPFILFTAIRASQQNRCCKTSM